MEAKFYEQEHCTIYGHGVWHYMIDCPIGHIHIVEWENKAMSLDHKILESNDEAEKYFQTICKRLLSGKML